MIAERYELLFKYDHQGLEGFDKAASGARAVKGETLLLAQALGATVAAIGAGTAAMVAFVKGQADAQRQLAITSAGLGITAQQGQQLQFSLTAAGVSMGVMEAAAKQLTSRNQETERALKALGVTTTDITGRQRAAGAVFIETAGKLSQIRSEFERSRAAAAAFGPEAAAALEPLLRTGQLLGPALDEGLTKNLERARLQMSQLDAEWERFKTTFGGRLAPIVIPILAAAGAFSSGKNQERAVRSFTLGGLFLDAADAAGGLLPGGSIPTGPLATPSADGATAQAKIIADLAAGRAASSSFLGNNPEGLKIRQSRLTAEIAELAARLGSDGIGGSAFASAKSEMDAKVRELESVRSRLKALSADPNAGALKLSDLQRPGGFGRPGIPPSLFRPFETFIAPEGDRRGSTAQEIQGELNRGFGEGLIQSGRDRQTRDLERARVILDLESRRIQLLAGPGGEEDAVRRITQLKLDSLEQQIALGADIRDAELERVRIAREGENELLELQRRRAEQYRDFFGQAVLASITRDGGGLSGFGRQQLRALQAQISTNIGSIAFEKVGPILGRATGGKDGSTGSGLLDRVLGGTIFDPKNSATDRNTKAINRLTDTITATAGGSVGGLVAGAAGLPGGDLVNTLIKWGSHSGGGNLPDPMALAAQDASDVLSRTTVGPSGIPSIAGASGRGFSNQYGSKGATTAVYAAALAAGAFGVKSGIQQGGGKGALNAVAAGAGAFAAISPEPISKGIAAAIATGAALVSSILGDPKQVFSEGQDRLLRERMYRAPDGLDITTDFATGGTTAGYGIRGAGPRIVVQVNALDAKSFMDRSDDIADAIGGAIAAGHPLRSRLAELPFTG